MNNFNIVKLKKKCMITNYYINKMFSNVTIRRYVICMYVYIRKNKSDCLLKTLT